MDITNAVAEVFQSKVVDIMQVESVQIIDKAEKPNIPVSPNKKLNLAVALILGISLGIFIILAIEYFDNTVKTPEDIEKYLELPVIGTIPVFPKS
jgi:capsular polysaccharide biosynthesis protein